MKKITIQTQDHYPIAAHYFESKTLSEKCIVISTGVGMPQRFFFNFAQWLATQGFHTYTYDYRGIALSKPKTLKGMKASYYEWTNQDFTGVSLYVRKAHPKAQMYHIGHSFGGNSLGMSTAYTNYEKFLGVGSQYGYYRNFPLKMKVIIVLGFGVLSPLLSSLLGYFPSPWIGLGEPLPKKVMSDWGVFLLKKGAMLSLANDYNENHYDKITKPMLLISIDDDNFAPKKAVDVLANKVYANAAVERLHLVPKEYGIKRLGHNNFFRKKNKNNLWPIVLDWFNPN